ncbi:MAG: TMEM175 family protein [Candidatus Bathyarchaeia archaeon]
MSDLIFGLALSLSAYSLLTRPPATLTNLASDLLSFTFSFLILISVWIRYTGIMSVLPLENTTTNMLNVAMLFSVSLVPYLFNLVTLFGRANETVVVEYASVFFAADMAALVFILAFFVHELALEEKQLIAAELVEPYRRVRNIMFVSTLLFLLTMVPQFWQWRIQNVPLRFYLWLVPIAVFWIGRLQKGPNHLKDG